MNDITTTTAEAPTLDKTFDPAAIEARWYAHWEANGLFRPERPDAAPFTIVNPPPNVTGNLHIGHALDNTLQDVVVRYERLRGKDALWVVGTDHAGIATQMVVERQLEAAGDRRTNYSREQFIEKVWDWKAESGGTITQQLRRLGCSMDWSREQFTMDPHFTSAVVKVFVDLYNQGLLYRDKRLVNWDPKLRTAISDLEVETREVQGNFWHFRYPLADGARLDSGADHIVVATTRPETMLADMAVAVNAADPRYKSVIGKFVELPITGRRVPIVADEHADPELGSGAVKITPGHDFNDFEVGKRAGFKPADMLNMFDAEARVVQTADGLIPVDIVGLDRFDARKHVVERMKQAGLLVPHLDKDGGEHDAEPRTIQTPYGDRGGVVIEPWLTDQWYVDAATLAQPAIEAVKTGAIEIVPKTWEKTWFNWMENIQPWCVSRQLWWGHQIPAWFVYDVDTLAIKDVFVAETEKAAAEQAKARYPGRHVLILDSLDELRPDNIEAARTCTVMLRDPDVLDTWFSSALWPFATLGWPDDQRPPLPAPAAPGAKLNGNHYPDAQKGGRTEPNLVARHYPNDLLISGFDILFFWDARMAMQGIHFMGEGGKRALADSVPWKRLYLHGLVRAADGQKMSKSKGNVVDPLGLIDRYGADALRFFMASMESQGRDVKMDEKRVEGYRNFATKLWNAARFCQSNGIGASTRIEAPAATSAVNKWIVGEVVETLAALDKAMADLRFDAAANAIYHFVWDTFCDWYIELIKPNLSVTPAKAGVHGEFQSESGQDGEMDPRLRGDDDVARETRAVAGWVLDQILVMLHPFMPFVTEELWSKLGERGSYPLITAKWPEPEAKVNAEAKREVEWLIELVSGVRSARTEMNIPWSTELTVLVEDDKPSLAKRFNRHAATFGRMAKVKYAGAMGKGLGYIGEGESVDDIAMFAHAHKGSLQVVVQGDTFIFPLEGVIDIAAEKARLTKALEASRKEAASLEGRLSNPAFAEKAKPEAVEKARADYAHHSAEAERLAAALARLG